MPARCRPAGGLVATGIPAVCHPRWCEGRLYGHRCHVLAGWTLQPRSRALALTLCLTWLQELRDSFKIKHFLLATRVYSDPLPEPAALPPLPAGPGKKKKQKVGSCSSAVAVGHGGLEQLWRLPMLPAHPAGSTAVPPQSAMLCSSSCAGAADPCSAQSLSCCAPGMAHASCS